MCKHCDELPEDITASERAIYARENHHEVNSSALVGDRVKSDRWIPCKYSHTNSVGQVYVFPDTLQGAGLYVRADWVRLNAAERRREQREFEEESGYQYWNEPQPEEY